MTIEEVIIQIEIQCNLYARAGFPTVSFYLIAGRPCPSSLCHDPQNKAWLITIPDLNRDEVIPEKELPGLSERIDRCQKQGLLTK